jgi:hypothetical protein
MIRVERPPATQLCAQAGGVLARPFPMTLKRSDLDQAVRYLERARSSGESP